jgi:hypothetical protein
MKKRQTLAILIVSFVLITACTCAPLSALSTSGGDEPSIGDGPSVEEDNFPLTPDPVSVSVTLDTEREVTYQEGSFSWTIETESAEGALFRLDLPGLTLLETGDEGELFPDDDSAVTMTPVLTIDGLPFSQGFLAAVQLGPEGGSLVSEAYLSVEIPGEYDPSELIGFAAEGSGEDFHLFPASFYSYDGTTNASFNITHFSLYGVAQVLESEIVSQTAHPPADPDSQDDQELAPLTRIEDLAPLLSNLQLQLTKSYTRLVKPGMTSLAGTRCEQVSNTAYQLNAWVSKVSLGGQTDHFQSQIQADQRQMYDRLMECIQEDCTTCLNPPDGVTPDRRQVSSMIVMIAFASDMASALGLDASITNSLWYLDYECSENAGLPVPYSGGMGSGCEGEDCGPSGPELACPGP